MVTRDEVLGALRRTLEPLPFVHAMWEGGAAAFKRVDEWSDIDLQVDVADDQVETVVGLVETALAGLSPIELRYEIPQPAWHGHWQAFYRLKEASPFLLIDFVIIKHSNPNKFLQPETHGQARVHFDKVGVVQSPPLNREDFIRMLAGRVETLKLTFDLFQVLTLKEIHRNNAIEAILFYHAFTLRPLVEALRIRYAPARHSFHGRYVYYDLPTEVVGRLEPLFFPQGVADLHQKRAEAELWFYETCGAIDMAEVGHRLGEG